MCYNKPVGRIIDAERDIAAVSHSHSFYVVAASGMLSVSYSRLTMRQPNVSYFKLGHPI